MAKRKQPTDKDAQASDVAQLKQIDSVLHSLLDDNQSTLTGIRRDTEISKIHSRFNELIRNDSYSVIKSKSSNQSTYDYIVDTLIGARNPNYENTMNSKDMTPAQKAALKRSQLENIFSTTDMNAAAMFLNGSSDVMHICDEVESVCAYMYQLEEAINILRDNVLGNEQVVRDFPFDITFSTPDDKVPQYVQTVKDALHDVKYNKKLNDHAVPKMIKFGRYYMMIIPYSEIGTKMLSSRVNQTHNIFSIYTESATESVNNTPVTESEQYTSIMEGVSSLLDSVYENIDVSTLKTLGGKDSYRNVIEYNLKNILVSEEETPPNITGISEASYEGMTSDLQAKVRNAILRSNYIATGGGNYKSFSGKSVKDEDKHFSDSTIDTCNLGETPGCFIRMVDPRQLVPIKIFDFVLGYYYFENYDYARMGTSITDILSNQINFQDHNMVIDNMVGAILKNLKYGDILKGDNNFKAMILNCIFYAERRNNPIRIKFVPTEYIVEFKTNCDQDDNGQPVLLRSLVYARLYTSLLLFMVTTLITKSTDTEFYYLKESALSQSYEDQVADIIEQFRNSNVDISQVLSGDLMHGNRAINKRYFMSVGTADQKPFDVEVVSGQNVDTHNDFLTDLKKMAIGATGVPAVAVDYMDEVEFATILKMTNTKTLQRSNNIQKDLNDPITESVKRIVKYNKPGVIPDTVLDTLKCTLRPANTINNNISSDELNNVQATVDSMIDTYYKGQETDTPDDMKFVKEETRKRLIMMMTSSLPWGEIEKQKDDIMVAAKRQKFENELKSQTTGDSEV